MTYSEIPQNDKSNAWQRVSDELRLAAQLLQEGRADQAAKILSGKPISRRVATKPKAAQPLGTDSNTSDSASARSTKRKPRQKRATS